MDEFSCDYVCRTVGESILKYNVPDEWCAEFEAYDCGCPVVCIQVAQVRKSSELMDVKLRMVANADAEFAGCMVFADRKTIAFKIDCISDFTRVIPEPPGDCHVGLLPSSQ